MKDVQLNHKESENCLIRDEIFDFMRIFDKELKSDKHFGTEINVKHKDGSKFHLPFSYITEDSLRIYVYTEHCGFFWFFKDDLEEVRKTVYDYNENKKENIVISDNIIVFNMEFRDI